MNHSQRVLATAVLAFIGFASSPAFANVLTVAPTGANYTQIQAAVNAASDGDVILISPGSYGAVTLDGKSLTLVKQGTANVTITGTTTVKNLTASQRVILSGLKGVGPVSQQPATTTDAGVGLVVLNNAGPVRVEYCTFEGAVGWADNTFYNGAGCCYMSLEHQGRDGAVLRDNAQGVSFVACELKGGRGANALFQSFACDCGWAMPGGDGLRVKSTLVALYDSVCIGGKAGRNANGGSGGAGCRTTSGTSLTGVFASGTSIQGGNGGDSWEEWLPVVGGAGGPGLVLGASTGVQLLASITSGGAGGFHIPTPPVFPFPPDNPGPPGAPISGSGSIFSYPESSLVMTTDRVARAKSVVDVRIQGTPGQNIHLLVSRAPTFQIMASWRGALLSFPGKGSVEVNLGPIPASGVLLSRYTVPSLPVGVPSQTVFVQAFRYDAVLGPKLAAGTSLILVP